MRIPRGIDRRGDVRRGECRCAAGRVEHPGRPRTGRTRGHRSRPGSRDAARTAGADRARNPWTPRSRVCGAPRSPAAALRPARRGSHHRGSPAPARRADPHHDRAPHQPWPGRPARTGTASASSALGFDGWQLPVRGQHGSDNRVEYPLRSRGGQGRIHGLCQARSRRTSLGTGARHHRAREVHAGAHGAPCTPIRLSTRRDVGRRRSGVILYRLQPDRSVHGRCTALLHGIPLALRRLLRCLYPRSPGSCGGPGSESRTRRGRNGRCRAGWNAHDRGDGHGLAPRLGPAPEPGRRGRSERRGVPRPLRRTGGRAGGTPRKRGKLRPPGNSEPGADRMDWLSRQFTTRVIVLMPVAIAINIVLGFTVQKVLNLPIYLDSIGTILVGVLAGPLAGALTGGLSNLIWQYSPGIGPSSNIGPFAVTAAVIGLLAGLWGYLGVYRPRPASGPTLWIAAIAGALTGIVAAIVSAPIAAYVYGGVTGTPSLDLMVAALRQGGADVYNASLGQGLFSDPIDKTITSFVVYIVLSSLSPRIVARFPLGERTVAATA